MRAAPTKEAPIAAEGTLCFTDVVGFTEFTAVQGDEEALDLLSRHEELLNRVLPPGARVIKSLGDGFMIWFTDPKEALEALLRFQEELEVTDDEPWPLWVRVAAHFGRPLRRGDDLIGHDVNVAARILEVAGPGEVLVSEALLVKVRDRMSNVEFDELGPVAMKGIPEPLGLYRAKRAAP